MSIISGVSGKTTNSSILRKSVSIKSKLLNTPGKVRFALPYLKKVQHVLQKYLEKENIKDYEQLVCSIRDCQLSDEDIRELLTEVTQCIPLLNLDLRLFVEAVLSVRWISCKDETVISDYQSFLVNLISAHNYHARFAVDQLVANFLPEPTTPEWPHGIPQEIDCTNSVNIHFVINVLLKVIPMCRDLLLQSLVANYPYLNKSTHSHELYLHNLLWILDYQPEFRIDVLHLIFSKLILLDVHAPKEEIEKMENNEESMFDFEDSCDRIKHPIAHTLDVCLDKIFNYFIVACHDMESGQLDWEKSKRLYQDMIIVFDKVLLPTYKIHHVQFSMFLLCSFRTTLAETFLNYLWKKVCMPNVPPIHRHTAVAYMASLVARGSFIPLIMLKGTLQQMSAWIHSYIGTQDGLENINSDVRVHSVFYNVCQALFYIIAFRYRDLVDSKKNLVFLGSLNLSKIITSRLNPLRVCQPAIVQNFASITRTYQLAYCYAIIEHNSRNTMQTIYQDEKGSVLVSSSTLDSFFPFDPFILKRSGQKIESIYLQYQMGVERSENHELHDMDDFLSYGTSPGFK